MESTAYFIFYVKDQEASKEFYSVVLQHPPRLHVPGMTEFDLASGAVLGLMPEKSIQRLLGPALPDPSLATGTPRAELYLLCNDAERYFNRALAIGAKKLSPMLPRDWGHTAGDVLDPDGHVLAFAHSDTEESKEIGG